MSRGTWDRWLIGLLCGCVAVAAVAEPPDGADIGERVQRLQAQAAEQQAHIDGLQAQLVAAEAQDAEAGRSDVIRQQIREILSEQEFRESLMPSMLQAGYDKDFFIRSTDDKFLMNIRGRMQFRWVHVGTRSRNHYLNPRLERDDRTGFDIERIRLQLTGHVYTPDLTYHMQFRAGESAGYDLGIRYVWLNYRFADALQFQAGIFKPASTRQTMLSDSCLQFVDRTMSDAVFGLGTGLGVRFWGRLFDKRLDWYFDVMNSMGDYRGRTITTDGARELDNNPALFFHAIWHALGENPGDLMKSQSDIAFHESPALDLGIHYAFNDDAGDTRTLRIPFHRSKPEGGGYGVTNSNGMQIHQMGVDAAFQWQGFSATAEYTWRFQDVRRAWRTPYAPYWLLTGDDSTSDYHGGYLQVGYFLPIPGLERKVEAVARVGGVSSIGPGSEGSWEYGAGLNYYIQGHRVKLQTDVIKIYESPVRSSAASLANVNDDALMWRMQLQVTF
ncbi:MAG: porin [Phycisphaerae bacterium]|jgi:hypothetical protein